MEGRARGRTLVAWARAEEGSLGSASTHSLRKSVGSPPNAHKDVAERCAMLKNNANIEHVL